MALKKKIIARPRRKPLLEEELDGLNEDIEDVDETSETLPYKYSITSYGADYPVDSLVSRLKSKDIVIPTFDSGVPELGDGIEGFQRQFMWKKAQCDRFIESLLLGLPVPGIFLVKQSNGLLLVLDGQQRLKTLQAFYEGILRGREFRLENVQEQFKDLSYRELNSEDRRRLDDSVIHATIIRQDEPCDNQDSVYLIFERLNTGGTTLIPQEIRTALYRGPLIDLLRELNNHASWRRLYGAQSKRLKDQELILRFFALYYNSKSYSRPMKGFLNHFIEKQINISDQKRGRYKKVFCDTTDLIFRAIGPSAFRLTRSLNAAVLDSVMFGVAKRLAKGPVTQPLQLNEAYKELVKDKDYVYAVSRATADEESVRNRLNLSEECFAKVN